MACLSCLKLFGLHRVFGTEYNSLWADLTITVLGKLAVSVVLFRQVRPWISAVVTPCARRERHWDGIKNTRGYVHSGELSFAGASLQIPGKDGQGTGSCGRFLSCSHRVRVRRWSLFVPSSPAPLHFLHPIPRPGAVGDGLSRDRVSWKRGPSHTS